MRKLLFVISIFSMIFCNPPKSKIELCFDVLKKNIGDENVLNRIKYCQVDSYSIFFSVINKAIYNSKYLDSNCRKTFRNYYDLNHQKGETYNMIILFQQFQAYLKDEEFDDSTANLNAIAFINKYE